MCCLMAYLKRYASSSACPRLRKQVDVDLLPKRTDKVEAMEMFHDAII